MADYLAYITEAESLIVDGHPTLGADLSLLVEKLEQPSINEAYELVTKTFARKTEVYGSSLLNVKGCMTYANLERQRKLHDEAAGICKAVEDAYGVLKGAENIPAEKWERFANLVVARANEIRNIYSIIKKEATK